MTNPRGRATPAAPRGSRAAPGPPRRASSSSGRPPRADGGARDAASASARHVGAEHHHAVAGVAQEVADHAQRDHVQLAGGRREHHPVSPRAPTTRCASRCRASTRMRDLRGDVLVGDRDVAALPQLADEPERGRDDLVVDLRRGEPRPPSPRGSRSRPRPRRRPAAPRRRRGRARRRAPRASRTRCSCWSLIRPDRPYPVGPRRGASRAPVLAAPPPRP